MCDLKLGNTEKLEPKPSDGLVSTEVSDGSVGISDGLLGVSKARGLDCSVWPVKTTSSIEHFVGRFVVGTGQDQKAASPWGKRERLKIHWGRMGQELRVEQKALESIAYERQHCHVFWCVFSSFAFSLACYRELLKKSWFQNIRWISSCLSRNLHPFDTRPLML